MGVIKRQGIKNTIIAYTGMAIGFLNLIVIQPHFLTKEELGLTRILYSFALLLAMMVPLGIGNATVKFFPLFKDPDRKNHGFFGFMSLFPLVGYIITAALIFIFKDFILDQFRTESPLFLEFFDYVFPLIFFNAFIAVFAVYCNVNFKTTIPTFLNDILVRVLTVILVSVYYLKWLSLDGFIAWFTAIYGIQLGLLLLYIFIFDKPKIKIDWWVIREKKFFELMRYGLLLWFAGVASLGLKYFDSIMIGKFMALSFVGIYTIAAFVPTIIEAPLNAFERIAGSKIAFAWSENDLSQIQSIYQKSSLYMFMAGGFLFLLVNLNIHTLLQFLPEGYQQGELVVIIISIGTLYNMATGLNAPVLFNSDKYRYGAVYLIVLAIVILSLQMLLIPLFGIYGAAIATSVAAFIYNSLLLFTVWKFFKLQPFDKNNLWVLFSIMLVFAALFFIPHHHSRYLDILLRSGLATLMYFSLIRYKGLLPDFGDMMPWKKVKF
ncbi:MAG: hypothetical protein DWQ44_07950 [Bacteroidetes bacterium]|nr:MAG: hypothetical protein DWQ33_06845 [Bacteroidota bacterium]REJ99696.1 MAG: hypothetical protein DWQ39_12250 [Bacteroidota bacterium]REK33929.1 MAG: hypothetical protein DWQ44_07950 [Bacteroidota bacterium]REK47695.1 MAG: hypothetical protein DWQ48_11985 [Bacteroidota bacterium]